MNAARVAQRLGQCATHIKMLEATSADHPERAARALALRNRISTSLEIGNFIHIPCPYGHWGMNLEDRRERLGLSPTYNGVRSAREARLQDDLRDGAEGMRKQLWNFRIGEEVEQLDKLDWFTVMVTLTVDPSIADGRRLIEDGKAWSAFLQRCAEVSARRAGCRSGSVAASPGRLLPSCGCCRAWRLSGPPPRARAVAFQVSAILLDLG